jgi:arylsulfatase A-like enzyme
MIYGSMILVFVVDGLRPDAITPEDTPTLHRLRHEGVNFTAGHAVFPTVTRVNAATIATGAQPATHGIVGNQMYVAAVERTRAFSTDNWRNLGTAGGISTRSIRLPAAACCWCRRWRIGFTRPGARWPR